STGWSPASLNYQVGHVDVLSATATSAELRTYVYEVWTVGGTYLGFRPANPSNVGFSYGAIGTRPPFTVIAEAPGLVRLKGTYPLTGSANYAAINWLWERSGDGGATWSFWSDQQNSQFIAYAGNYQIDWRLSARRLTTLDEDTDDAVTRVCIPYSPATCEPLAPPMRGVTVEGPASFALRQTLTRFAGGAPVGTAGAIPTSPSDARAQIVAEGLVALDYAVPAGRAVDVRIRIYDRNGRLVRTLLNAHVSAGEYHLEWDKHNEAGRRVSPGVYVAIMEAAEFRATRRLVVTN
ncbi:MAG: FlgD immunoglobulin-like domain containing protein, partial [Gemmatimonadales bacterium]